MLSNLLGILDYLIRQNITNRNLFKTFDSLARHVIAYLRHKGSEHSLIIKSKLYLITMYVILAIIIKVVIVIIVIIEIRFRKEVLRIYEAELVNIEATQVNESDT